MVGCFAGAALFSESVAAGDGDVAVRQPVAWGIAALDAASGGGAPPPGNDAGKSDPNQPSTPIGNDLTNYQGDRIRFEQDLVVGLQAVDGSLLGHVCLPKGTRLLGEQGYTAGGERGTLFMLRENAKSSTSSCQKDRRPTTKEPNQAISDDLTLRESDIIRVTSDQISGAPPDRNGLTYGVLTVPFKYHFQGNKDIGGSATLGPYAGYRATRGGFYGLSFVGFVGASNVSVTQNIDGKSTTQTLAGLSYGAGIVATVKGQFQLGAVLGVDQVSKSANYQYNGKVWLAVELGYAFLQ